MKVIVLSLLALTSLSDPLAAQGESGQNSRKHVRLLCLGEPPPWREDIKGGVRVQLPPPPGSLPPSWVTFKQGGKKTTLAMRLSQLTQPVSYPAASEQLEFLEGKSASGDPWFVRPLPKSSHSLIVLWRGSRDGKWFKPRGKVLVDSVTAFPAGNIRLVNFGHLPVKVRIAQSREVLTIEPGKGLIREVETGENELQIEAKDAAGKRFRIFRNVFKIKSGERVNAFIYKADGVKPRRPMKLYLRHEVARNYQEKKEKRVR